MLKSARCANSAHTGGARRDCELLCCDAGHCSAPSRPNGGKSNSGCFLPGFQVAAVRTYYGLSTLQNRRLLPNLPNSATVPVFGDKLSPKSATIVSSVGRPLGNQLPSFNRTWPILIAADKPLLNCSLTAEDSSSKCIRTVLGIIRGLIMRIWQ